MQSIIAIAATLGGLHGQEQATRVSYSDIQRMSEQVSISESRCDYMLQIRRVRYDSDHAYVPGSSAVAEYLSELVHAAAEGRFAEYSALGDMLSLAQTEQEDGVPWTMSYERNRVHATSYRTCQECLRDAEVEYVLQVDSELVLWYGIRPPTLAVYNRSKSVLVYDLNRVCPLIPRMGEVVPTFMQSGEWEWSAPSIGEEADLRIMTCVRSGEATKSCSRIAVDRSTFLPVALYTGSPDGLATVMVPSFRGREDRKGRYIITRLARADVERNALATAIEVSLWEIMDTKLSERSDLRVSIASNTSLLEGRVGTDLVARGQDQQSWPSEVVNRIRCDPRTGANSPVAELVKWLCGIGCCLVCIGAVVWIGAARRPTGKT